MFYDKKINMPKPDRRRFKLSEFLGVNGDKITNTLPCNWTSDCYNFAFKNNKLISGVGVSELKLGGGQNAVLSPTLPPTTGAKKLFVGRNSHIDENYTTLVLSYTDCAHALKLKPTNNWNNYVCSSLQTSATPYLYKDKDLLLMATGNENGLKIFDGTTITIVDNALKIKDLCVHFERVFAVVDGNRNSLWYSSLFNPYDWTVSLAQGGYINFDGSLGNINRIKSFADYLYIFCDFGIYRLSAYGQQEQFSLKRVYCACGQIYPNSIVDCKDKIAFVSSDGFYLFDGYGIAKVNINTEEIIGKKPENIEAVYCNQKYFICAVKTETDDYDSLSECVNKNVLVSVDMQTRAVNIMRGIDLHSLAVINAEAYNCVVALSNDSGRIVCVDESGNYLNRPIVRLWKINKIDFGKSTVEKVIRGIEYTTDKQYIFGVVSGGEKREFVLSPREHYMPINIRGSEFDFYIKSDSGDEIEISAPYIIVDFLRR